MKKFLTSILITFLLVGHVPVQAINEEIVNQEDLKKQITENRDPIKDKEKTGHEAESETHLNPEEPSIDKKTDQSEDINKFSEVKDEKIVTTTEDSLREGNSSVKDAQTTMERNTDISGKIGSSDWWIDSAGTLFIEGGKVDEETPVNPDSGSSQVPSWDPYRHLIKKIEILGTLIIYGTSVRRLFADMNLTEIIGFERLHVEDTKLYVMETFYRTKGLKKIKLTSQQNIGGDINFYESGFEEVDLSEFRGRIGAATFVGSENLKKIIFGPDLTIYQGGGILSPINVPPTTDRYTGKWLHIKTGKIFTAEAIPSAYVSDPVGMSGAYVWETYPFSLNFTETSEGNLTAEETSLREGETTIIKAIPKAGYRFVRWNISSAGSSVVDVNSASTTFTMGTENATVTAQFEEIPFTAEPVPQKLALGGQFTEKQLNQLVKNVIYNGEVLLDNAYEVELVSQPNAIEVGDHIAEVSVKHKASGRSLSLNVPVTVGWGNTLRYKGWGNASVGAFVYHPDAGVITPRWGILNNNTFVNNTEFGMNFYYSFKQFRGTDDSFDIKDLTPVKELSANGNSPADHFTSEGDWATNMGDIIEVKHMQARNRLTIMNNEEEQAVSVKDNQAYFELTKEGYHLLQFDRVETPKVSISKGMTTEELDKEITNYLDMSQAKNVEIVGFTKYPETSKIGESKGTIRVCEKLTTGKYVQKDYEVVFTVESTTLEFQEIDHADFDFGGVKKNSQSQTVSAVGDAAPALTISDFSDSKSWEVRVSQPEGLKDEQNNELLGASIRLKNIQVAQSVHDNILVPARTITLSAVQQLIAQAQTENIGGGKNKGITQLQIGDSRDGKLSGIDIHIPRNTVANASKYRTTIEWELVGDPTLMNG
ncbi:hypothetical protein BH747_09935 [Enterococcus villorum]|uniref:Bacterial repeat domain-containing protein n=1 Tax=Enterococcus villorum TaxID=112904 RepID=A0A1V8YJE2_9ENTE|nr:WxL domain-containing protein [Enterococcus villorum]OQO69580.1 hypothetical protein BH747_09935 [Enterococcus villorum]OQO72668.1 hypothetical protein BH744_11165 [Enterococcus villorum]